VVEIHHELTTEERSCDCCGNEMKTMGKKHVRDEVVYVPAKLYVERHISHSYECRCHNPEIEAKPIKSAVVPKAVFSSGSIVSATLLAWVFYLKFVLSVPLYRQVNHWELTELEISRNTLANWVINGSRDYLEPLYNLLLNDLRSREVIHGDETPYQILNRSDGKPGTSESRLWCFHTLLAESNPIIIYHSSLTRSQTVIEEVLSGYQGYIHCDAYAGYQNLAGIIDVGCWAHVRRKFNDIAKVKGKTTHAQIAINYCNRMFKVERELKELEPKERHEKRQTMLKPIMDEFYEWLGTLNPMGNLKKAVDYALNQKSSLMRVLDDGRLLLSNNHCEQQIKTLVIGRKNHLFSTSEGGGDANAKAYTIVATAKQNGLDPYKYLVYLFEHLPNLDFYRQPELLEAFLPWAKGPQEHCAASLKVENEVAIAG